MSEIVQALVQFVQRANMSKRTIGNDQGGSQRNLYADTNEWIHASNGCKILVWLNRSERQNSYLVSVIFCSVYSLYVVYPSELFHLFLHLLKPEVEAWCNLLLILHDWAYSIIAKKKKVLNWVFCALGMTYYWTGFQK